MQKLDDLPPALTPAEAMTALGISRRTLDRYVETGRLQVTRLPSGHRRFSGVQVAALIAGEPWEPAS